MLLLPPPLLLLLMLQLLTSSDNTLGKHGKTRFVLVAVCCLPLSVADGLLFLPALPEETAEHWKLEQHALLKGQEMAEAAAREAERQAMEETERHLKEGKLVPGANSEVILIDPGPVGLTFYADDSAPPRVRKVKKDRREFWDNQGVKDGATVLAVGDTPTAHLTSADLLPLLNGRPLRLQFALDAVGEGINGTDSSGQTALHRALEAGDEAAALDVLANPEFKSINVQEHSRAPWDES